MAERMPHIDSSSPLGAPPSSPESQAGRRHLGHLRTVLVARGWKAEVRPGRGRDLLYVVNPAAHQLNETIACDGGSFRWAWGQGIGPADDVFAVADKVQRVLREAER
ncbi:hypothetical protein ACFY4C_30330 [Actinomadura viridis]|uniref:hypothetical protein n=1 Tax=Actinomadura viridis TaxID=58110 RepID=UPI00367BF77E